MQPPGKATVKAWRSKARPHFGGPASGRGMPLALGMANAAAVSGEGAGSQRGFAR